MLKKILKLDGAHELTKKELKAVNGGVEPFCAAALIAGTAIKKDGPCPPDYPFASGGCCFPEL
ncbi:class IIb bacteriocin, lactobin A/cerein 7B family [Flavobacterium artemisiae]|uniref:Class IIb bacteriocin, lactobin A/cerein 7B family n=1 Tax=Flavobacterium artemisiae TaxID=2126556 RepID=A0ABW4HF31_9FLAO